MTPAETPNPPQQRSRRAAPEIALGAGVVAVAVAAIGAIVFPGYCMHAWRSIGPGAADYRACYALIGPEVGTDFDVLDVDVATTDSRRLFRFEIRRFTSDNSPIGEMVVKCEARDGVARLQRH